MLREDSGCHDITLVEAVAKAMATAYSSADLSPGLQELSEVIAAVDSNLAKTCTLLNDKIKALERKQVTLSHASPSLSALQYVHAH